MAKSLETWSKLDNSAKIYPMLVSKKNQNIFRLSVSLKEEIDEEILHNALAMTIGRFPGFQARLMKGAFWYYFDHNFTKTKVYPLDSMSIKKITDKTCNGYCFRVSYFEKQIICDFFHAICDATGAAEFVKSLVYTYLNLTGK
ncbi:MAG: MFS transporter, partial [Clostridia bacterium]|nr:MFS transporter [Clostridia bacterium]